MTLGTASIVRANARHIPLADNSVDLIVTSPPYFALRSYQDTCAACRELERTGDDPRTAFPDWQEHARKFHHYGGQIGDEPTPAEFVDSLIEVTAECMRVLKPSGSIFVNLGDKYSGAQAQNTTARKGDDSAKTWRQTDPRRTGIPNKSLMGIPWRYALRCIDDLGLILRAEVIWSKPNGLPESVTDRARRSHETWFHFTLQPRYFSAVDEIREPTTDYKGASWAERKAAGIPPRAGQRTTEAMGTVLAANPLGKLPGSVWTVPTEPLRVPDHLGVDHFAAFPTEFPRRIITGWSPRGVCVECGEGRRPVAERDANGEARTDHGMGKRHTELAAAMDVGNRTASARSEWRTGVTYGITGYSCACNAPHEGLCCNRHHFEACCDGGPGCCPLCPISPAPLPPATPAVVLDPFGGTGTTAMVAKALGRHGISVDMSADYCRLAEWRVNDLDQLAKVRGIKRSDAARDADTMEMDSLFDMEPESPKSLGGGLAYANKNGRVCAACGYRSQYASKPICEKCGTESERAS